MENDRDLLDLGEKGNNYICFTLACTTKWNVAFIKNENRDVLISKQIAIVLKIKCIPHNQCLYLFFFNNLLSIESRRAMCWMFYGKSFITCHQFLQHCKPNQTNTKQNQTHSKLYWQGFHAQSLHFIVPLSLNKLRHNILLNWTDTLLNI